MANNMKQNGLKSCIMAMLAAALTTTAYSQTATPTPLSCRIDSIIGNKRMTVGVAAECDGMTFTKNDSIMFPLLSVFKVHVAMAAIAKMQALAIAPDSTMHIKKEQLLAGTYSPLKQKHPNEDIDITMRELLRYSVAMSDNNACDILIELCGGIDSVDTYIRSLGLTGFCLSQTEASMHSNIQSCRKNWSHPSSMQSVLKLLFGREGRPFQLLRDIMATTTTGPDKIPAGVPAGFKVAHKTGSSDRIGGIKISDNDAGVVFLPHGKCYIVAFIMDSAESDSTNAATIAAITREIINEARANSQ